MVDEIVGLKEIADRTGIKMSTLYKTWPKWRKHVKVLKLTPTARSPRFYWSDINKLLTQSK